MAERIQRGPDKPSRVSAMQGRKGQHSKSYKGDVYMPVDEADLEFTSSARVVRGETGMSTIPKDATTKRNGGTQKTRINKGRQRPL